MAKNWLKMFYIENGLRKQLLFKKLKHFENGQKWPKCKGYSPCKILTLGQENKIDSNMRKTFLQTH